MDTDSTKLSQKEGIVGSALQLTPYLKGLLGDDIGLYVSDLQDYLYCKPGKVKLTLVAGDAVKDGSTARQTMRNATRTLVSIDKKVYGMPYIGTGFPLLDPVSGKVVGSIVTTTPIDLQTELNSVAVEMENQISNVSMAISNLSATSQELSATAQSIASNAQEIQGEMKKTDNIVFLIQEIAGQTHLLGLNAAIEAARLGDMGRGFNVVAVEIRRLSSDTQKSAKDILQTLNEIQNSILTLTKSFQQMSAAVNQQATSTYEINSAIEQMSNLANLLKKHSDNLIS